MPMLGDLLAAARHNAGLFDKMIADVDPELAAGVVEAAERMGLSTAGFIRTAVADFERFADGEDWATLASRLRDGDDPGTACVHAMVHWRLTAARCDAHSSGQ